MNYFFNILAFLAIVQVNVAQEQPEQEKIKTPLIVHDVKLGVNLLRAGRTFFGSGTNTQELQVAATVNRWNVVIDYGRETNTQRGAFFYENEGDFFRAGLDRNFVQKPSSGNVLSVGLRYAGAGFQDQLAFSVNNGFGNQDIALGNPRLQARWIELVANLRGKLTNNVFMGFTLRWQFARQLKGEGALRTFDIPGFGDTRRENSTAFDYYLLWRIPLGKKEDSKQ